MIDTSAIRDMQDKYNQGWCLKQIALTYNANTVTLRNVLETDITRTLLYKNGDRDKVRQMYADGVSLRQISRDLGYAYNTIRGQFAWYEIREADYTSPDEIKHMQKLYAQGWSIKKLTEHFKRNRSTIKKHVCGISQAQKITQDLIHRLQCDYDSGWSVYEIAKRHKLGRTTVYKYVTLRKKQHIDS